MALITIVTGANLNQQTSLGGAHCTFYKVNKKTQILLTNAINAVPYNLLSVQQKAVSVQ